MEIKLSTLDDIMQVGDKNKERKILSLIKFSLRFFMARKNVYANAILQEFVLSRFGRFCLQLRGRRDFCARERSDLMSSPLASEYFDSKHYGFKCT
jgi:hypothetical protein